MRILRIMFGLIAAFCALFVAIVALSAWYAYTHPPSPGDKDSLRAQLLALLDMTPPPPPAPPPPPEVIAPADASWTAPAVIPAIPGGTLTTPSAVYTNAQIVKVEADRITIRHANGTAIVPMWQLPSELQQKLNYDPKAAQAAAVQRPPEVVTQPDTPQILPTYTPTRPVLLETSDYHEALAASKSSGRKMLLHFTGSDWCPPCKMEEEQVISTPEYSQFVANNFICVTVDFPQQFPLSDELKAQNDGLKQKFGVATYPTLLVVDSNEKPLGAITGYDPGVGPDPIIKQLQQIIQSAPKSG